MRRSAALVVALVVVTAGCDQVFNLTRPPDAFVEPDASADDAMIDALPVVCGLGAPTPPRAVPSKATAIVAGRFDENSGVDVAVGSSGIAGLRFIFDVNGSTTVVEDILGGAPVVALASGDLNHDMLDDVVAVAGSMTYVLLQTASNWDIRTVGLVGGTADSVAIGNFDGAEPDDLLVAHATSRALQLVLGSAQGYTRGGSLPTMESPVDAIATDIDGDLDADVVAVMEGDNGVAVWRNNGGAFMGGTTIPTGLKPTAVVAGKLGNRQVVDVVVANHDSNDITILRNDGNGNFAAEMNITVGQGPVALALADLDNDGNADILVVNNKSNSVTLLRGTPTAFEAGRPYTTAAKPVALAVADITEDGHLDVAVLGEDGFVIHPAACAPPP